MNLPVLVGGWLLVCAACGPAAPRSFQEGDAFTWGAWGNGSGAARLVWVLQPADYLQCETQAREIRRAQLRAGDQAGVTILSVGGREDWLRSFVRRERLRAHVVSITQREYRRRLGRDPHSALYLVVDDTVRAVFPSAGEAQNEEPLSELLLEATRNARHEGSGGRAP